MTTMNYKLALLLLLSLASLPAQNIISVCASGCSFSSLPAALSAASPGDTIELAAGESFDGGIHLIAERGLRIRSSRWRELPPAGHRIDPVEHADLLATIRAFDSQPALLVGATENAMGLNGIDLANNTIVFDYAPPTSTLFNDAAVVCRARTDFLSTMPQPLVTGRKYWIRDWNLAARRGRLAETPGGPPVDITTIGSTDKPNYYDRPACVLWSQPQEISFHGIRFATTPGVLTRNLVQVGNNTEPNPREMGPRAIEFQQSVITGQMNDNGPLFCLALFGGYQLSVVDSWIGHCKQLAGEESKAIGIQNIVGAVIRNNYLSAASINILTAGADSASGDVNRDLLITGNFLEKQGYMMYKEDAGAPTGACYYGGGSGAFYRRTNVTPNTCANGACYTCQPDKTWALDTGATYRSSSYLTKNLLELKDCENCRVEGNFLRGGYAGPDSGQGWCFGISVGVSEAGVFGFGTGYHRARSVYFRNNWADYCYSGIFVANSAYNASFNQIPMQDIVFENNLLSNLGGFPELSQWPAPNIAQRFSLKLSTGIQGLRFANNTFRGAADFGVSLFKSSYEPANYKDTQLDNNIISFDQYSLFLDSSLSDCTNTGIFKFFPGETAKRFRNNVWSGSLPGFLNNGNCSSTIAEKNSFVIGEGPIGYRGPGEHSLSSTSSFSAANPSASQLSVDGASVGADVELIEQYAIPARQGEPSIPEQLRLSVTPGTTAAILRFRRPVAESACQVTVYTSSARVAAYEHDDTKSGGARLDARASSIVSGGAVQFVAGAESPLTPESWYSYDVTCGALRAVGRFQTQAPGQEPRELNRTFRHSTAHAVQIEYDSAPVFINPIAMPPVILNDGTARVSINLPSGIRYWRRRFVDAAGLPVDGGAAQVFVALFP